MSSSIPILSNNTGILDTYSWLWLTDSEQAIPVLRKGSRVRKGIPGLDR